MKLMESSQTYFNKLIDKSSNLNERLKLADSLWDLNDSTNIQANKQQLIVDWIVDLLINKRKNSINENEFGLVLERLNHFLNDSNLRGFLINNGLAFSQVLIDSLSSSHTLHRQLAADCCIRLCKTKFANYFTRNFDHMIKVTNYFLVEINDKFSAAKTVKQDDLSRVELILEKYFICLKSQQNQNRIFNRFCTQILFNLLCLIENCKALNNALVDLTWQIIKHSLLSKSQSNIYLEFFKNLPNSFSAKSNYQVAILFTTIQNESTKSSIHLRAICKNIDTMVRELYSVLNCSDYKSKMTIVQFIIDLIWKLNENCFLNKMETDQDDASKDSESTDLVIEALTSLINIIDELSLFNLVDDANNENLFKNWSTNLLKQTYKCKFNKKYAKFLIQILQIDHLTLEYDLDLVLSNLMEENNLTMFLNAYFDVNVNFRQLARATHKIVECIKTNQNLKIPIEFYNHYSMCLENYHVDSQTLVEIWKSLTPLLKESNQKNLTLELLKFVNCILTRINLTNQRLPAYLKIQSLELLEEIKTYLNSNITNDSVDTADLLYFLECYFSVGLVYLIQYRYSIMSSSEKESSVVYSDSALKDLQSYINDLYKVIKLNEKLKKQLKKSQNLKLIFFLQKLKLMSVYLLNVRKDDDLEAQLVQDTHDIINVLDNFKTESNKMDNLNELLNFNIEKKINDAESYSIIHTKFILIDNIYMVLPIISSNQAITIKCFRDVLNLILNSHGAKIRIDDINLNALFNDKQILDDLFNAFLGLLIDLTDDSDQSNAKQIKKYLNKILEFLTNNDDESKQSLLETKKYGKLHLNNKQRDALFKFTEYLPIEFLDTKYALIIYLLNERVDNTNIESLHEKKLFQIYFNLFDTSLVESLPIVKLELWLNYLFGLFEAKESHLMSYSTEIFEKLIKKCVKQMLVSRSLESLQQFTNTLLKKILTNMDNLNYESVAHLTLIQILEKLSKIQEFSSNLNRSDEYNSASNELFHTILSYFIQTNDSPVNVDLQEKHNFYICSILVRRVCSPLLAKQSTQEQLDYFKQIFKFSMKNHKDKMKQIESAENKIKLSAFHFDFLKTCVYFASTLNKSFDLKIKPIKLCKHFLDLLVKANESYEFEINYYNQFKLNKLSDEELNEDDNAGDLNSFEKLKHDLIRSLSLSARKLSTEDFGELLEYLESLGAQNSLTLNMSTQTLIRLTQFIRFISCEIELNDNLKTKLSEFIQKLLLQLQPFYVSLKLSNQFDSIIQLLVCQSAITSSKYMLFPSHLVVSTLQAYLSFDFAKLKLEQYVSIQEQACKTVNNLLNRYSKKFSKIVAIVCNLIIKLISSTTSFCNQNELNNNNLPLAIRAAQDLERIVAQLVGFKKYFSKIAPYMISEYVCKANTIPIHPDVKNILSDTMYNLISMCDIHGISQLHVSLPVGTKELFKTIYAEYEKYWKYTGKA